MKLTDLDPQFLKCVKGIAGEGHGRTLPDGTTQWGGFEVDEYHHVDSLSEADLVSFLCPKCFEANKGPVGTHSVHVYFEGRNVPPSINNGVRWPVSGTGYGDLTTTPSILLKGGCNWHGYITNGEVTII
jgi:hypothetical protein